MNTKTLFIGFQNESIMKTGRASWRGEHLERITAYTNVSDINPLNTPKGIGYLTGRDNFYSKCYSLNITYIENSKSGFAVYYDVESQIEYTTMMVVSSLRSSLLNDLTGKLIPFCAAVESDRFLKVIAEEGVIIYLRKLASKNNWEEIYKMYQPIDEFMQKPQYKNNHKLLEAVSFAIAKLSEVYVNLKKEYPDELKRKEFLKKKKQFRKEVIKLRKRIIELTPENPGAYSNLAYSHYQFCRELSMPGGRRDGNLSVESFSALENIENALALDPNRITDLYRKGQLLTRIIPNAFLYGGNGIITNDKISEVREKIICGISAFHKLENVYELIPEIDEKELERYHKEYIKALYDCSLAYESLVLADWNYTDFFLPESNENGFNFETDIEYIEKGLYYIIKCIQKDRKNENGKDFLKNTIQLGSNIGEVESVYKIYTLGKLYFRKYIVLKKSGKENEALEFAEKAFKSLKYACSLPFSKNLSMQNKSFILEKIARYFISVNKPEEAIKTLDREVNRKFVDYYIRYTYSIACILLSKKEEAVKQLELSLKGFNMEKYLAYLMLAVISDNETENKYVIDSLLSAGKLNDKNVDINILNEFVSLVKSGNLTDASDKIKTQLQISAKRLKHIIQTVQKLN